jgi:hypothetical protein
MTWLLFVVSGFCVSSLPMLSAQEELPNLHSWLVAATTVFLLLLSESHICALTFASAS